MNRIQHENGPISETIAQRILRSMVPVSFVASFLYLLSSLLADDTIRWIPSGIAALSPFLILYFQKRGKPLVAMYTILTFVGVVICVQIVITGSFRTPVGIQIMSVFIALSAWFLGSRKTVFLAVMMMATIVVVSLLNHSGSMVERLAPPPVGVGIAVIAGIVLTVTVLIIPSQMLYEALMHSEEREMALHEAQERYREIVDSAPVGIFRRKLTGEYEYINEQLAHHFRCESIEEFFQIYGRIESRWADREQHDRFVAELREHKKVEHFDVETILASGEHIWTRLYAFLDESETIVNGFSLDVTEERVAQQRESELAEQLHHSQKMDAIGQLAGGVAHDFNNALAGIIGAGELIKMGDNTMEETQSYADVLLTAAERARDLTQQLLAFSRKGPKQRTVISLDELVENTITILEHTIHKGVTISFQNNASVVAVEGDRSLLYNSIMNIAINASHAMPDGGALQFTLQNLYYDQEYCEISPFDVSPGTFIELAISDSGVGMSPAVQEHIFEPFFTTKGRGHGTGLGLAAVYGTIQDHRGVIRVDSEVGRGTVFRLSFPTVGESSSPDEQREELFSGVGTVLFVDDEPLIRTTASALLTTMGYRVICGENGAQGVAIFEENHHQISVVILDMMMPVMNGREAFFQMRAIDPSIPIVVASGFSNSDDIHDMYTAGLYGFLQKPFRRTELSQAVYDAVQTSGDTNE